MYINLKQSQQNPLKSNQIHPWTELDPVGELEKRTPLKRRIFNKLMWMERCWKIVEPSQEYIARKVGCSREYVNKCIKEFIDEGWVSSIYRHRHTSIYMVNDFFKQPHIRKKLAHLLPAIVCFSLSLLQSNMGLSHQSSSSHHINKYFNKYISIANSYIYNPIYVVSKKEMVMNKSLPNVKGLNLTRYGKIRLSVYPPEAIAYAETELAKGRDIRSPLGFVHSKCKEWCIKHGRKIEWGNKYKFMEEGETFHEDEPQVENTSATSSLFTNQRQKEERPAKGIQSIGSFLRPLSYYQQRDETIQKYNPGKGYGVQPATNDPFAGAEMYIKNIPSEWGTKALARFGFMCPDWKNCTDEQKKQLLLKYPFIAEHINKQEQTSFISQMAERVALYHRSKQNLSS